jgi:hypothetical protein
VGDNQLLAHCIATPYSHESSITQPYAVDP